ncbi:MAG: hypothetical protein M1825_003152 [Sarcosagium campestre]|nr:MAG: hypothetical protein M1825_003152 [Sarcosagium campestre]
MEKEPLLATVPEPFPISLISDRYFIFDINAITHARHKHHICGVLIGTIPHLSQQNLFLGVPLELMPEEARLLVDNGAAYIVDDAAHQKKGYNTLTKVAKADFRQTLAKEGARLGKQLEEKAAHRSKLALERQRKSKLDRDEQDSGSSSAYREVDQADNVDAEERNLFESSSITTPVVSSSTTVVLSTRMITPTTSYPPLPVPRIDNAIPKPLVPSSYPLYAHLHSEGYFISPGLRFGCQYLAYPGDPLRFHSHFLAVGADWDEQFDLLDLVGAGRLGTGVKKGFLLGGKEPSDTDNDDERIRTFSIEWGGM